MSGSLKSTRYKFDNFLSANGVDEILAKSSNYSLTTQHITSYTDVFSFWFVTQSSPTRDEPLRKSAWEATLRVSVNLARNFQRSGILSEGN